MNPPVREYPLSFCRWAIVTRVPFPSSLERDLGDRLDQDPLERRPGDLLLPAPADHGGSEAEQPEVHPHRPSLLGRGTPASSDPPRRSPSAAPPATSGACDGGPRPLPTPAAAWPAIVRLRRATAISYSYRSMPARRAAIGAPGRRGTQSSTRNAHAAISPPRPVTSSHSARAVPPVASRSSWISTRAPPASASAWTSSASIPYSSAYAALTVS